MTDTVACVDVQPRAARGRDDERLYHAAGHARRAWRCRLGACSDIIGGKRGGSMGLVALIGGVLLVLLRRDAASTCCSPTRRRRSRCSAAITGTDRTTGLRWVWPWMGKQEALGPRQQHHFRADQGQRSARQPDRDGGAGGVARDRHRPGAVRRRRLQGVRRWSRSRPRCAPSARAIPMTISSIRK